MADKDAVQLVLIDDLSIGRVAARSSLVARGRKDAITLVASPYRGPIVVSARELKVLIARTQFAIGSYERAPALNQALLILKPMSLAMAATDAHRLSVAEKTGERIQGARDEVRVLIPYPAVQEIYESLLNQPDLESSLFVEDNETFSFHIGNRTVTWVRSNEKFPDFEAVMSRSMPQGAALVVVPARDLYAAVQRVAPSNLGVFHIRLCFESAALRIMGLTSNGEYDEEVILTSCAGRPVQGIFIADYLRDFLAAIEDQGDVMLRLNDPISALEMESKGQENGYKCRYLCASMRDRSPRG